MSIKFDELDDIQHVLSCPTMWIGPVKPTDSEEYIFDEKGKITKKDVSYIPGFVVMFREIISNSIDEYIKTNGSHANKIKITIDEDFISVEDNGRGIPSEIAQKSGLPISVSAFTRMKAGSNFNDLGSRSMGMHGVGAVCTNIFSVLFTVETCDGTNKTSLECSENLSDINYKITKNSQRYTKVTYYPDFEKLSMKNIDPIHMNILKRIVYEYAMCFPGISFYLNSNSRLEVKSFRDYARFFGDQIETFTYENLDIAIISGEFQFISFVNGINAKRGGTHVDYLTGQICNGVRDLISKKYKEIKPGDIKSKLMFVINIRNMSCPRFDGQTKESLSNPPKDYSALFADVDFEKMCKKISKNEDLMFSILETFKIKEELKKRAELGKKERKLKKLKVAKLVEAQILDSSRSILYLTEGLSATTNFLPTREAHHAAYPLRGKFISAENNIEKIMKNKEVIELLSILGLKLTDSAIHSLNYGKIAIMTDSDEDGHSIAGALINFFYKFWPDIIKQGRLYRAISPIIKARHKETKEVREFYTLNEFHNLDDIEEWSILEHNKGLGSLSEADYKKMLNTLVQVVEDKETAKHLEIAFGDNADLRKKWMMNWSKQKKNLTTK